MPGPTSPLWMSPQRAMRRVLPAPADCLEVLVSASGSQLYEVVGTASYGNIQTFAA